MRGKLDGFGVAAWVDYFIQASHPEVNSAEKGITSRTAIAISAPVCLGRTNSSGVDK